MEHWESSKLLWLELKELVMDSKLLWLCCSFCFALFALLFGLLSTLSSPVKLVMEHWESSKLLWLELKELVMDSKLFWLCCSFCFALFALLFGLLSTLSSSGPQRINERTCWEMRIMNPLFSRDHLVGQMNRWFVLFHLGSSRIFFFFVELDLKTYSSLYVSWKSENDWLFAIWKFSAE